MPSVFQLQVEHIKAKYGDYFGITVAGYPGLQILASLYSRWTVSMLQIIIVISVFQMSEAHPEVILGEEGATEEAYSKDLAYLKRKVLSNLVGSFS